MSGLDIDTLWDLKASFSEQTPQFHGYHIPGADEEPEKVPGAFPSRSSRRLPFETPVEVDTDDDMPPLQAVSNSSSADDRDSYGEWGSEDDHWDESDWDTEDEEGATEYIREMMAIGMSHPDFLDPKAPIPEFDKYAEERADNPFLKLLGSLRGDQLPSAVYFCTHLSVAGRMFSSNTTLKTTDRIALNKQTTGKALSWLTSQCIGIPTDGTH